MADTRFLNKHFNEFYMANTDNELDNDASIIEKIEKTFSILEACEEVKADAVCLCVTDPCVPSSEKFPFGGSGSMFIEGNMPKSDGGYPKAWKVRDMVNLRSMCGNSEQAQIDPSEVVAGAYVLVDGRWYLSHEAPSKEN